MPEPSGRSVEIVNAHIVKSACLAAIAASLATSSPAWAEDEGIQGPSRADSASRAPRSAPTNTSDFDEAVMPDRPIPREAEAKGLSWRAS